MNFGFVRAALKGVGRGALWTIENAGPAAATAFGGPLAGELAQIAVQGIIAAQAKHGPTVQPNAVDPNAIGTGLAKKLDVMQYLESQAGTIANLVLQATGRPVQDPERVAIGVDKLVEGLVDILKGVGQLPTHTAPAVQEPAVLPKSDPIPTPTPAPVPMVSTVMVNGRPIAVPTRPIEPNVISLLQQVLSQLQQQKASA